MSVPDKAAFEARSSTTGHVEIMVKEAIKSIELLRRHHVPEDVEMKIAQHACWLLKDASEMLEAAWKEPLPDASE